jgi:2'-5' RNA ligase
MDVFCDPILIEELSKPGSDPRHGVNLIARPPREFAQHIRSLQDELRRIEPDQYYYPAPDLHLTILEIGHSMKAEDAAAVGEAVSSRFGVQSLKAPAFTLHSPRPVISARSGVLRFEVHGPFESLRSLITDQLSSLGIPVNPRHGSVEPHVTFMRYMKPLSALDSWPPPQSISAALQSWLISELWLTWGATWFGMRSQIRERGPYPLS